MDSTGHLTVEAAEGTKTKKKVNPLVDLIDTEKAYVELLAAIIRRVAAAWSRTNFPPPELDAAFRSIEAVYRSNRSLLAKLNEIGPNPSSPKALGDLLMRWIDDLEAPYTRYCNSFLTAFDDWIPVQSNPNLSLILSDISDQIPPSLYATNLDPTWTLDTLFLMPATRLKYYKKLYTRLLKSTQPGRGDHKLLLGANERLTKLLDTIEDRSALIVGDPDDHGGMPMESSPPPPEEGNQYQEQPAPAPVSAFSPPPRKSSAAPGAMPSPAASSSPSSSGPLSPNSPPVLPPIGGLSLLDRDRDRDVPPPPPPAPERESTTSGSSGRDSRHTEGSRGSVPTSNTSASGGAGPGGRASTDTMTAPIVDLERRLATERVLDIFTMNPRKCRLQMAPPNLTFTRRVRFSTDVSIDFTPRSTGTLVQHRRAHIFLLTDLFLVCERMTEEERRNNPDGADMWLCYPPLSAKHIVALDLEGAADNMFEIRVMKKEVLIVHAESRASKQAMLADFREAYEETMALAGPRPPQPQGSLPPGGAGFPARGASMNSTITHANVTGPPSRSQTQSPNSSRAPSDVGHGGMGMGMEPPRAQFGRMAAGSDPHLPSSGGAPGPGDMFSPPPRGASRNAAGPGGGGASAGMGRSNSSEGFRGATSPPPPPRLQTNGTGFGPGMIMGENGMFPPQRRPSDPHPHLPPLPPSPLPPLPLPGGGGRGPSPLPPQFADSPTSSFGDPHGGPQARRQPSGPPPSSFPPLHDGPSSSSSGMPNGYNSAPSMRSFDTSSSSQSRQPSYGRGPPPPIPGQPDMEESPPSSPEIERPALPTTSVITADMKCKVFLKQHHAQWKALGSARLLLYQQDPGNIKQLVVSADNKAKTMIISTIVLMDAVERVGKTGVAIELSDKGLRTGIVYMIQLKSEASATGFFTTLLSGSDRAAVSH